MRYVGSLGEVYDVVAALPADECGESYLVRDSEGAVATLTILSAQLAADEAVVARFVERRAQASRAESGAVIVSVDLGVHEGRPFVVYPYVPGVTLRQLLGALHANGRRLRPEVACALVHHLARSLDEVHDTPDEHGQPMRLSHGAVSTDRVIIGFDGTVGLAGFGIARDLSRPAGPGDARTLDSQRYAAPEVLRGDPEDTRADIHALAVVLWEAITMRRFHAGNSDPAVSTLVPDAPSALDLAIAQCVSPDASRRPPSLDEFSHLLTMAAQLANRVKLPRVGELASTIVSPELVRGRVPLPADVAERLDGARRTMDPSTIEELTAALVPNTPCEFKDEIGKWARPLTRASVPPPIAATAASRISTRPASATASYQRDSAVHVAAPVDVHPFAGPAPTPSRTQPSPAGVHPFAAPAPHAAQPFAAPAPHAAQPFAAPAPHAAQPFAPPAPHASPSPSPNTRRISAPPPRSTRASVPPPARRPAPSGVAASGPTPIAASRLAEPRAAKPMATPQSAVAAPMRAVVAAVAGTAPTVAPAAATHAGAIQGATGTNAARAADPLAAHEASDAMSAEPSTAAHRVAAAQASPEASAIAAAPARPAPVRPAPVRPAPKATVTQARTVAVASAPKPATRAAAPSAAPAPAAPAATGPTAAAAAPPAFDAAEGHGPVAAQVSAPAPAPAAPRSVPPPPMQAAHRSVPPPPPPSFLPTSAPTNPAAQQAAFAPPPQQAFAPPPQQAFAPAPTPTQQGGLHATVPLAAPFVPPAATPGAATATAPRPGTGEATTPTPPAPQRRKTAFALGGLALVAVVLGLVFRFVIAGGAPDTTALAAPSANAPAAAAPQPSAAPLGSTAVPAAPLTRGADAAPLAPAAVTAPEAVPTEAVAPAPARAPSDETAAAQATGGTTRESSRHHRGDRGSNDSSRSRGTTSAANPAPAPAPVPAMTAPAPAATTARATMEAPREEDLSFRERWRLRRERRRD